MSWGSYQENISKNNFTPELWRSTQAGREFAETAGQEMGAYLAAIHLVDARDIHYPFAEKLWPELVKDRLDDKIREILEHVYSISINYVTSTRFPTEERLVVALPEVQGCRSRIGVTFQGLLTR